MPEDIDSILREMTARSAGRGIGGVNAVSGDGDDMKIFFAWPTSEMARDAAISICRDWADILRRKFPERKGKWAASILMEQRGGPPLGTYWIGWAGRPDAWLDFESQRTTDPTEWQTLYQRLNHYLSSQGISNEDGKGDFFLFDEDNGHPEHQFTVYRIEFLTAQLVAGVQGVLRHGYDIWSVIVLLSLAPPFDDIPEDAIEIRVNDVIERWNKVTLKERLGARLKL